MKDTWLWSILGITVAILLYLLSKKSLVEALASQLQKTNPALTYPEAISQAAAIIAYESVDKAQQAELTAGVPEQAAIVTQAEIVAGATQAEAISNPTPETTQAATSAAATAAAERAKLEDMWKNALEITQAELENAKKTLASAEAAYNEQLIHINRPDAATVFEHKDYGGSKISLKGKDVLSNLVPISWNDRISSIEVKLGFECILYEHTYYGGQELTVKGVQHVRDLGRLGWNDKASSLKCNDDAARTVLNSIKSNLLAVIAATKLVTERILTITADVRLLGILLTTCNKLDQIAGATIEKIAALEEKLAKPS